LVKIEPTPNSTTKSTVAKTTVRPLAMARSNDGARTPNLAMIQIVAGTPIWMAIGSPVNVV
jgi:hypothetical protein